VDVDVNRETGAVRVRHVYVGFDAGMIVNPDGLRNQIEGGTIMGISRALKEEVTFRGRSVTSSDWHGYPVLRFTEVPDAIEIVTLDNDHPPFGRRRTAQCYAGRCHRQCGLCCDRRAHHDTPAQAGTRQSCCQGMSVCR
jgi:hypothetical protein